MKTKKQTLIELLQTIKGPADFMMIAETYKEPLKKSRTTKNPTPANLQKVTKLAMAKVCLGATYEDAVNAQRKAEGLIADFKAEGTYCLPLNMIDKGFKALLGGILARIGLQFTPVLSKVVYKHKENDQFYLRVYPTLCKEYLSKAVYFDADGNDITDQWDAIEAEYFTLPKKDSGKQGVDKKIICLNYKIEGLKYLGDMLNELTDEHLQRLGA